MASVEFESEGADSGFFVYAIESPSPAERRLGTSEGEPIRSVLALSGVPVTSVLVGSSGELERHLRVEFPERFRASFPDRVAVLHLSAHGNDEGLIVAGSTVAWAELARWLVEANWEAFDSLTLSVSACHGIQAFQAALGRDAERMPFMTVVGSTGAPDWGQSAAAFVALYTQLSRGSSIRVAVEAMRWASRHAEWEFVLADELRVLGNSPLLSLEDVLAARRERLAQIDDGPLSHS